MASSPLHSLARDVEELGGHHHDQAAQEDGHCLLSPSFTFFTLYIKQDFLVSDSFIHRRCACNVAATHSQLPRFCV